MLLRASAALVATREGYADAQVDFPSTDQSDVTLVLFRPRAPQVTALSGPVLHANGAPASGARVALGHELVAVDGDGMYELNLALTGDAEKIVAIEVGSLAGELTRPDSPDGARSGWPRCVEITLGRRPLAIAGTVVDEVGAPLAGARVGLDDPTAFGKLGDFPLRLEALAASLAPSLDAVGSQASVGALGETEQHGTATPVGDPDAMLQWIETDGDGHFALRGLKDRAYTLDVVGPNLEYIGRSRAIDAGTEDARIVIATGERSAELRGHVVTRLGEPVQDVFISPWVPPVAEDLAVRDGTASVTRFFFTQGTRSDEQGAFRLTNLPKRYLQFFLGSHGIVPSHASVDDVTDPLDFELVVRARVEVTLAIVDTGRRIDRVTAVDASGAPIQALRIFADGHSTLDVVYGRAGLFSLTTDADRLQLRAGEVIIDEIALRLVPGEVANLEW